MHDTRVVIALVAMLVGLSVICAPLELLSSTESTPLVPVDLVNGLRRSWMTLLGELELNATSSMANNNTLPNLSQNPASAPTNYNFSKNPAFAPTNYERREIAFNQSRK
jgi:hypothetical protein